MPPVVKKFDKRWLAPSGEAVDGDIFRLLNNQALTAWDSAKESAVQLMKLDASSKLQLLVIPQLSSNRSISADNDLIDKKYLVDAIDAITTSVIEEGSNLYFTDARAKSSAVIDFAAASLIGSETDMAASVSGMKLYVQKKMDDLVDGAPGTLDTLKEIADALAADEGVASALDLVVGSNYQALGQRITDLTTSNIAEGINLYFTDVRATDAAVVDSTAGSEMIKAASVKSMKSYVRGEIDALSTSDIEEGTNLYFTDARAKSSAVINFAAASLIGSETNMAASVAAMKLYVADQIADFDLQANTDNIEEGSLNLYFTAVRATDAAVVDSTAGSEMIKAASVKSMKSYVRGEIDALSTSDIEEGTNLYFTDVRATDAAVVDSTAGSEMIRAASVKSMKSYVRGEIDALSTSDIEEGTNLYFTDARAKSSAVIDFAAASLIGSQTDMAASVSGMKLYVQKKMDDLVDGAPGTLDTLKEIADALAADEGVASALDLVVGSNYQALGQRITDLTTSNIAEGSNLYFTDARAKSAAVLDTLSGSEVDQAPSVHIVKEELLNYIKHSGSVVMTGDLDLGTHKILNVVAGTQQTDAVNYAQLSDVIGDLDTAMSDIIDLETGVTGIQPGFFSKTLTSGDIANAYLDLPVFVKGEGVGMQVYVGRVPLHQGLDYNRGTIDGVTRISWIGSVLSGDEALVEGDAIYVKYWYMQA